MKRWVNGLVAVALCSVAVGIPSPPVGAQENRITVKSIAPFATVAEALERAVTDEKMGLVCHANAQRAAAGRGVTIKGNQVLMVFRNDFAVRLLAADPAAGFEAPIRIYVYENGDGTATVSYLPPARSSRPIATPRFRRSRKSWMESSRQSLTGAWPHDDRRASEVISTRSSRPRGARQAQRSRNPE